MPARRHSGLEARADHPSNRTPPELEVYTNSDGPVVLGVRSQWRALEGRLPYAATLNKKSDIGALAPTERAQRVVFQPPATNLPWCADCELVGWKHLLGEAL